MTIMKICASYSESGNGKMPSLLRYPIVLVHGIGFRDDTGDPFYWGRIPKTLREAGIAVYFGRTDAWGDYDSNAAILKSTIEEVLLETRSERVNLIGHSKGGLDSRYLVWKYGFGGEVASLTTIATPHHGAEVADLVYGAGIIHTKPLVGALETLGKIYGDSKPDIYRALAGLTTGNMREFNREVERDGEVYYQSLYSTMESAVDDLLFLYTFLYLQKISGNNDGLVSEASACWGDHCRKIPGSLSHHDIIDMKARNMRDIDVPALYLDIALDLARRGF